MAKQIVNKETIVKPAGEMEDFKRPSHPDFMDSTELAQIEFTGIRHNSVTQDCEIWLMGKCERKITVHQLILDQYAIDKAVADVFALEEVAPDIADLRRFRKDKGMPK